MTVPILEVKGISKTFGKVKALDSVDFYLQKGVVHGLLGENGAGKSSLMNVLSGIYIPEQGTIKIQNKKIERLNPELASSLGIGMVHQEFRLIENFTIKDNLTLSKANIFLENFKEAYLKYSEIFSLNSSYNTLVKDLSVGEKQKVEIMKLIFKNSAIMLLDEPTAVLVPQEVNELFKNLNNLKENGVTIIFISHKLDEVLEIADAISVMRAGKLIDSVNNDNVSKTELAEMMIGKSLPIPPPRSTEKKQNVILDLKNLTSETVDGRKLFTDVSFNVFESEILGIAGVEGNGQKEVVESIIGINDIESGEIFFNGEIINNKSTRQRLESGISFIPEDRQLQAMIMDMNLTNNVIIGRQNIEKYKSNLATVKIKNAIKESESVISLFDVKTPNTNTLATALSGGNQQKFVVGRELEDDPSLLIASQPTRGIDIGAQSLIWEKLRESRDNGLAVLLISADLEELIGLSDRIIVFYQGSMVKELNSANLSPEDLGGYMTGLKK